MEKLSLGYTLLCVQNALHTIITPELRAVVVDLCQKEPLLYLRFYYDGEVDEDLIELWSCAATEASADLGCFHDVAFERIDAPQTLPPLRGCYAYLRKEPYPPIAQDETKHPTPVERELVHLQEEIGPFISPVTSERWPTHWGMLHRTPLTSQTLPARPDTCTLSTAFPVAYAQLSVQRALLGVVTPELRAVVVRYSDEARRLYLWLYHESTASPESIDDWELVVTKTLADFGPGYLFDTHIQQLDRPQKTPFALDLKDRYAYRRTEAD